jgi:hypothetical protein
MASFDKVVQNAAEKLLGDERLRSNLTDPEAKIVLDWALTRLKAQTNSAKDEAGAMQVASSEMTRIRAMLNAINAIAKSATPRLAEGVASIEPSLQGGKPFTRQEIMVLLTMLINTAWQMHDQPVLR